VGRRRWAVRDECGAMTAVSEIRKWRSEFPPRRSVRIAADARAKPGCGQPQDNQSYSRLFRRKTGRPSDSVPLWSKTGSTSPA